MMKKINLISFTLATAFLISCGGGSKEAKEEMKAHEGVKGIVASAADISKRQEELKLMEPLTEDEFFSWAPETVMGLPLKESTKKYLPFDKYRYSGYVASYKGNDKSIRFEVFDGAGSTIYRRYAGMLSSNAMSQEKENYYEKNVERDGIMVHEWYDSKRNDCSLMLISDDRFVATIVAEGFSPDEVWENIDDFELDNLN